MKHIEGYKHPPAILTPAGYIPAPSNVVKSFGKFYISYNPSNGETAIVGDGQSFFFNLRGDHREQLDACEGDVLRVAKYFADHISEVSPFSEHGCLLTNTLNIRKYATEVFGDEGVNIILEAMTC